MKDPEDQRGAVVIHYSAQSGAWCGAGWEGLRDADLSEVTCVDCLQTYEKHLRSSADEARTRRRAMSDDNDVQDGMLFESTKAARVQERFVVGQDERHTVPLVKRWLALGTVRPVPTKPLDDSELECMTAALAALRTKLYGSQEHETARRTLELLGPRLAEEVERVRAAEPTKDSSRLGEIQCLAYELGAVLRGEIEADALVLVATISRLALPAQQVPPATSGPCEVCRSPGVARLDPYDADVNEEYRLRVLCAGCYEERSDAR